MTRRTRNGDHADQPRARAEAATPLTDVADEAAGRPPVRSCGGWSGGGCSRVSTSSKKSNSMSSSWNCSLIGSRGRNAQTVAHFPAGSTARLRAVEEFLPRGQTNGVYGADGRSSRPWITRARPLPADPAARLGRIGIRVARREESSGRDVALKIVPRDGNAPARAEREATAAARLRHERCLRARAFARDPGHVYIVYDYVPGRTLREAMRAGELTDAGALEAGAQILDSARPRPRARHRPSRREAGERPARRTGGGRRQALRLRAGRDARGGDADGGR